MSSIVNFYIRMKFFNMKFKLFYTFEFRVANAAFVADFNLKVESS